jgi:hypothetical protein
MLWSIPMKATRYMPFVLATLFSVGLVCAQADEPAKLSQCGVAMLDAPSEVIPIALHYLGLPYNSQNPEDYKKAQALLLKLRPHIVYFDSSRFISDLANGNICVVLGWAGGVAHPYLEHGQDRHLMGWLGPTHDGPTPC